MKEQLISFETAKLAKEKGFDWKTYSDYRGGKGELHFFSGWENAEGQPFNTRYGDDYVAAPTQSLLQKWLREEHNLNILFNTYRVGDPISGVSHGCYIFHSILGRITKDLAHWTTYENALEKGLIEALKLI